MSKGSGIGGKIAAALKSVGIKAPWQMTGPVSSPEYLSHLPKAVDYRVIAPASQPTRVAIPQAEPEHVYDIKYYTRDSRRTYLPGGSKVLEKATVGVKAEEGAAPESFTPGKPVKWGPWKNILDNDHNGYTL